MEIRPKFEHFCRICTIEQEVGIMIFSDEGEKMMLRDKITKYLHIEVTSEDRLPKMICISCCTRLDAFRAFAEMAHQSQNKLNKHIQMMDFVIKEEKMTVPQIQNGHSAYEENDCNYDDTRSQDTESDITEMEVKLDPMMFLDCVTEDSRTNDTQFSNATVKDYSFQTNNSNNQFISDQYNSLTIELVRKVTAKQEKEKPIKTIPDLTPIKFTKKANGTDGPKPFICPLCPRSFLSSIALQNHMWLHSKNKTREVNDRVACPVCQKEISTKGNLKVHLETHRPKGKYGCEICGRIFKTNSNLVRHKEYHGGEVHSCTVCGRVYPTNSTLRAHSITHSSARPHKCPMCKKSFKRNQDLKFHINQHTGARPYRCPYCPKAFASSGNCFSHRKRMHSKEVERDRDKSSLCFANSQ